MALPADWDNAVVSVDPHAVDQSGAEVLSIMDGIVDRISAINTSLADLRLSWVGAAQKEQEDFAEKWDEAWVKLFGTNDNPDLGILYRFAQGIQSAAVIYGRGDRSVSNSFAEFQARMEGVFDYLEPLESSLDQTDIDLETLVGSLPPKVYLGFDADGANNASGDGGDTDSAAPANTTDVQDQNSHYHTTSINETF
ncbi:WXG100 family type VII secretion target [Actinacidiphila yeochonensis]|uniref:WXG100 family type VII secretion target n=1 Tax=Actinacidiphila yeochonensis TaxID=89050 RepID=UPI0012FEDD69|nr:WXG100 family type VII secretion target [Actinacidiphila yeochonensis]